MVYDKANSCFILSNGKAFDAYGGYLSIDIEDNRSEFDSRGLYEGFDGEIINEFSAEEKKEIADYMIALWQKWKNYSINREDCYD